MRQLWWFSFLNDYGLILLFSSVIYSANAAARIRHNELMDIKLRFYKGPTVNDNYIDAIAEDAIYDLENKLDSKKPTVLYIHGFNESIDSKSVRTVVDAYLKRQSHNILAADYGIITARDIKHTARRVEDIAEALADALNDLKVNTLGSNEMHIIGYSIGAQIAGHVGRKVFFDVPRITGLDPAGPEYKVQITVEQLTTGDATFVDVIHTDRGCYGADTVSADADFYPNYGKRVQPGCSSSLSKRNDEETFCSSERSWRYYAESVTNERAFMGIECENMEFEARNVKCRYDKKVPMGYATPRDTKGSFYMRVNEHPPYGKG